MAGQPSRFLEESLKSPKKQRYAVADSSGTRPTRSSRQGPSSRASPSGPQQQQQRWAQRSQAAEQPQEAGGSNEGPGEAVTDAAKAFRELRVRPALSGIDRAARAGSPHRGATDRDRGLPERPSSPKKRKATYNIDKEFILKDEKVKRNTDTQGDISQARGQLGQLLFEFSQIELNRDLLEAIKRTESKTGRSGGRTSVPGRLDRAAFELAVADAAELLQAQLSTVEVHSEDAALRNAILRSYAVQAIATFADEDSSDEEEAAADSSDDENNDSNSRRQQLGASGGASSSQDGPQLSAEGAGSQQSHDMLPARPASAAAFHSPARHMLHPHHTAHMQHPQQQLAAGQQQQHAGGSGDGGGGGGSMMASPQRLPAAGSTAEQASSSFLPDAPPDSALEDTATAGLRESGDVSAAAEQQAQYHHQQQRQRQRQQAPLPLRRPGMRGRRQGSSNLLMLPEQEEEGEEQHELHLAAAGDEGHGMQQRMRMLSLEAEGSALQQPQQRSSCSIGGEGDEEEEDGPQDMIRSPAPVTSRRMPLPVLPEDGRQPEQQVNQQAGEGGSISGLETQQLQLRQQGSGGAGGRRAPATAAGVLEDARRLVLSGRAQQQQRRQQQQAQQQAEPQSSDGHSAGQASSAPAEQPKRQRRSGDLLPPLQEQTSQHNSSAAASAAEAAAAAQRRVTDPGSTAAAAAAAATAAQRALILGSLQPGAGPSSGRRQPQQHPQQQPQQPGAAAELSPASPFQQPAQVQAGAQQPQPSGRQQQQQQADGLEGEPQQQQQQPEEVPAGLASDAALRLGGTIGAAHSGSSEVWGSTLVCADLTLNDVASQYWPFLRSAMQGQASQLQAGDKALVASLVKMLGETITDTYMAEAGSGRRPAAEVKSLVAATAFDDFFRAKTAAESSGASLG